MKMTYSHRLSIVLLLLLLFIFAPGLTCSTQQAQAADDISLDYQEIDLPDLVKAISKLTGRNFVYDETLRGKVSIISPETMSEEEAYQLFLTVLNIKGYTLVKSNKVNKIVPIKDAKESNLPITSGAKGENFVTQLVRLEYADAQTLATAALQPLISKTSNLSIYEPTNTLILTDSAANIARLIDIVKSLDVPMGIDQLEVLTLQHADAETVAQIANNLFNSQAATPSRKGRKTSPQAGQVIAYPRTNTLLAIASVEELSLLQNLIGAIDVPSSKSRSDINVYNLKNSNAEDLAKSLNEIMTYAKRAQVARKGEDKTAIEPLAITAVPSTNSLLISASPKEFEKLREVIEKLDIQRLQVYVEALILELSMDATRELGISLQGAGEIDGDGVVLGTGNLNTGSVRLNDFAPVSGGSSPSILAQTVQGLMLGGLFNPITTVGPDGTAITVPAISALIQLSQTSGDINILSAPRLLTSDNKEAEIIIGSNVPIITNRLTDTSNPSSQSVAIERKDVALTLRFTPQITEGDLVSLDIFQEVTDISSTAVGDVNEVGPTLTKRQLRNTVLAEDGKTVTLGGLIGTNVQKSEFKVPLFGDIPLLGRLFKSSGVKTSKTNLLVFITPKIIHNASEMAEITRRSKMVGKTMQTKELESSLDVSPLLFDSVKHLPEEAQFTQ